jgi:hypothetical protein
MDQHPPGEMSRFNAALVEIETLGRTYVPHYNYDFSCRTDCWSGNVNQYSNLGSELATVLAKFPVASQDKAEYCILLEFIQWERACRISILSSAKSVTCKDAVGP